MNTALMQSLVTIAVCWSIYFYHRYRIKKDKEERAKRKEHR